MMKLKHCQGSEASRLPRRRKVSVHGPKTIERIESIGTTPFRRRPVRSTHPKHIQYSRAHTTMSMSPLVGHNRVAAAERWRRRQRHVEGGSREMHRRDKGGPEKAG